MAVKTMILKPSRFCRITTNEPLEPIAFTPFPEDTDSDKYHLLVSEDISDEDATYLTTNSSLTNEWFIFEASKKSIIPLSIRVVCRACTTTDNARFGLKTINDTFLFEENQTLTNNYQTYTGYVPSEELYNIWSALYDEFLPSNHSYGCRIMAYVVNGSSLKTQADIKITQLYMEIDYEEPSIYVNQNDQWKCVYRTFQKNNGIWEEISQNECKNIILAKANENQE